MSTLTVGAVKSLTAGTPPSIKDSTGVETGQFCRAWVNFNGAGTVAIRDSFNVSSITDNGTGDYTINFTNALPNANYAVVLTTGDFNSSNQVRTMCVSSNAAPTTATCRISNQVVGLGGDDYPRIMAVFFGD